MALFDLLGRRWALRIVWELRDGGVTFRELQARGEGISSSVLNERLHELRDAGVVAVQRGEGYVLTAEGAGLVDALEPLHTWAARWSRRVSKSSAPGGAAVAREGEPRADGEDLIGKAPSTRRFPRGS